MALEHRVAYFVGKNLQICYTKSNGSALPLYNHLHMGDICFLSGNLLKFTKNVHPNEIAINASILSSEQCFTAGKGDCVVF